jgi:hypothetical protein
LAQKKMKKKRRLIGLENGLKKIKGKGRERRLDGLGGEVWPGGLGLLGRAALGWLPLARWAERRLAGPIVFFHFLVSFIK